MFRVLIADDDFEDRELLKLEITRALGEDEPDIRFREAVSVREAVKALTAQIFDLMTLDIEFDRMNEGIDALPELFETHPTLNIIVISGKLDKREVAERLFRFTKDNVLKGKRWARHFDVLDKKDDKRSAIRRAYSFALEQREGADRVRDLFLQAESYLEKNMMDKCLEVYQKIQNLAPGEMESTENIRIVKGDVSAEQALEYYRTGEKIVASLLLGYHLENRLRAFTAGVLGRTYPTLSEGLKEMEQSRRISQFRKGLFSELLGLRNKAIHQPTTLNESDFRTAVKKLTLLEETAS
ncbi:MAG: response regulator [Nitrospirae bacterium]|nr:response regulator [Nitrospirota bacterium]NTW65169.1 response regulator [Nitrospirota bacterium]